MMANRVFRAAMLSTAALALGACAANPGPVMGKATDKLVSYFEAKQELANVLQQQLGGPTSGAPTSDFYKYRLVAINGPAYPVGSILAVDNQLDVITRDCVFGDDALPREDWTSMPRWSSNSTLDLDLGIPAPFTGLLKKAETSVDAGAKFSRDGVYQIEDISQTFLSRFELTAYLNQGACGAVLAQIDEPVIFVRGMIFGRETLRSARGLALGLDARIVEGESGQLQMSYDNNGAYELAETEIRPKFAIMAKIQPRRPRPISQQEGLLGTLSLDKAGRAERAEPSDDTAPVQRRPSPPVPTEPASMNEEGSANEAAVSPITVKGARINNPLSARFSVSELTDEEIAVFEQKTTPQ